MFLEVKKTGIWFVKKLDLFLGTNKNKTPLACAYSSNE